MQINTINIVSRSYHNPLGGPGKVVLNTIKGFNKLGQPYTINHKIENYRYNWIHDDQKVFTEAVVKKIPCVVGPNLFVMPSDLPWGIGRMDHLIYLHPAKWTVDAWKFAGFSGCELKAWPAGIDWEEFQVKRKINTKEIMLYIKKRPENEKEKIIQELGKFDFKINILEYGKYTETEFKDVLQKSFFGVWSGTTESQGIALQEALASGIPLIVINKKDILDNTSVNQRFADKNLKHIEACSVPYFDDKCGLVIQSPDELESAVHAVLNNYNTFDPLSFIKENLSLEKQARELLEYLFVIPEHCYKYSVFIGMKLKSIIVLNTMRHLCKRIRRLIYRKTGI